MASSAKQTYKPQDLFIIPLADGSRVLGQIVAKVPDALGSVVCIFTNRRSKDAANLDVLRREEILSVQFATSDLLDAGRWPVVGQAALPDMSGMFDFAMHQRKQFVGTNVVGSANMTHFLNAAFALSPWDLFFDPAYFDKLLVSQDKKPEKLIYKAV